jgi:hypothetical protein
MPGHSGTSIVINSAKILGRDPKELADEELEPVREMLETMGMKTDNISNDAIRQMMQQRAEAFRDDAPMTAAQAAGVILDGVRKEQWRILVGEDAQVLDRLVREDPENVYEPSFMQKLTSETDWRLSD